MRNERYNLSMTIDNGVKTRIFIVASVFLLSLSSPALAGKHHTHKNRPVKADVSVKKISKKEIPPEVMNAFVAKYPGAEIKGQEKQIREKVAFYQITSSDSGKSRDVLFQADGVIVEVAESVEEEQIPQNIRTAVKQKYPDASISNVFWVTRGEHVEYEISLETGKKTTDVVANLAGKVFTVK